MWQEQKITVGDLRNLIKSGEYEIEIDTPDGWQKLGQWFDKGDLPMVRVTTESGLVTECATNHMLQVSSLAYEKDHRDKDAVYYGLSWVMANELLVGDFVFIKKDGIPQSGILEKVISVEEIDKAECYDFEVIHENHRYWGDGFSSHNSGKSFVCANIMRNALEQGVQVIAFDTENGLTREWLNNAGIDLDKYADSFLRIQVAYIDDLAVAISNTMKELQELYKNVDPDERPKVMIVIDSLSMLLTRTESAQFESGDVSKGDMGRGAKANKAFVKNCVVKFAEWDIGLLATNHTYVSQDMFDPDDKISGGQGPIYAASIVVAMKKLKLKEDDEGNKTTDVKGIRSKIKVMKSRYTKPFEAVEIKIPYEGGIDEFSGLVDLFENLSLLTKDGNRLKYVSLDGTEFKMFRKQFTQDDGKELLKLIMKEFADKTGTATINTVLDDIGDIE